MQPATIKIFLIKGNPEGLRTAEISNWTGKAITSPRTDMKDFLSREELDKPGVYILAGTDPESGESAVYIGEAESVSKRIRGYSEKDFWVSATAFVSKDENLTKAHTRHLEGELIEKAIEAGRAVLLNSASSGARLPESEVAEMKVFLQNIYQLLPILGLDHFRTRLEDAPSDEQLLYCKIKGLVATGKRTPKGFLVFRESQAVLHHRQSARSIKLKREKLLEAHVLAPQDDHLVFTVDVEFPSPSMAGSVVRGGNTNGLTSWKNADGKSLRVLEQL